MTTFKLVGLCPPGCAGHLNGNDTPLHISALRSIVATAGGEVSSMYVSRQLTDKAGAVPEIRLAGAGDAPMLPEQAIQLGMLLIAEATMALTTWTVR